MTVRPVRDIASYHAHIYFEDATQRDTALTLRDRIAERFAVSLGRVHDRLVGPHARAMYQISFDVATFTTLVPWLMLNRSGLTILVHPNTGRERTDHLTHALWLGEVLPIMNEEMLSETAIAEGPRAPNTQPSLTP